MMWTPCTKREIVSGCHLYIGYIDATTSCHPNNCQPSLPADCRPMTRHGSSTSISVISKIARIFFLMSNWLWLINPYFDWFVLFQYWQTKKLLLAKANSRDKDLHPNIAPGHRNHDNAPWQRHQRSNWPHHAQVLVPALRCQLPPC